MILIPVMTTSFSIFSNQNKSSYVKNKKLKKPKKGFVTEKENQKAL